MSAGQERVPQPIEQRFPRCGLRPYPGMTVVGFMRSLTASSRLSRALRFQPGWQEEGITNPDARLSFPNRERSNPSTPTPLILSPSKDCFHAPCRFPSPLSSFDGLRMRGSGCGQIAPNRCHPGKCRRHLSGIHLSACLAPLSWPSPLLGNDGREFFAGAGCGRGEWRRWRAGSFRQIPLAPARRQPA
jgi:hypothetical protein